MPILQRDEKGRVKPDALSEDMQYLLTTLFNMPIDHVIAFPTDRFGRPLRELVGRINCKELKYLYQYNKKNRKFKLFSDRHVPNKTFIVRII